MDSVAWTAGKAKQQLKSRDLQVSLIKEQSLMRLLPQQMALILQRPTSGSASSPCKIGLWRISAISAIIAGRFLFMEVSIGNRTSAQISLCVPAGAAFGTGDHGSTKGCSCS